MEAVNVPSACRRCGAPLAPERTSWGSDGVGAAWSCTRCGAIRFEAGATRPRSTEVLRETGRQADYRTASAGEVVMVRRWRRPIHFLMLAFPVALVAMLVLAVVLDEPELIALSMQLWGAGLAAALAGYVGLCGLLNTTRLELHDGALQIVHGPLPWKKNLSWPSNDFSDVWTQHVRVVDAPDIYRLRVALRSGGELVLLDELPSLEDGVFLEEKIAAKLGLAERS